MQFEKPAVGVIRQHETEKRAVSSKRDTATPDMQRTRRTLAVDHHAKRVDAGISLRTLIVSGDARQIEDAIRGILAGDPGLTPEEARAMIFRAVDQAWSARGKDDGTVSDVRRTVATGASVQTDPVVGVAFSNIDRKRRWIDRDLQRHAYTGPCHDSSGKIATYRYASDGGIEITPVHGDPSLLDECAADASDAEINRRLYPVGTTVESVACHVVPGKDRYSTTAEPDLGEVTANTPDGVTIEWCLQGVRFYRHHALQNVIR